MDKTQVLQELSFGRQVAEDEIDDLTKYFVETDQWRRVFSGQIDIVYGPKGSGKSALYSLLIANSKRLKERNIIVVSAEEPRGAPAFRGLIEDPPTGERDFVALWKIYFLVLVGDILQEYASSNTLAKLVVRHLADAGLLKGKRSLSAQLRSALEYVRSIAQIESLGGGLEIDPVTGMPKELKGTITLREPSAASAERGSISADELFRKANEALQKLNQEIWILLDRLDVAFADSQELEINALRALFKVYLDLLSVTRIRLKIFLRTDIWQRLTKSGFREASHVTRYINISWDEPSLLNLIIRRVLQKKIVQDYYQVKPAAILKSAKAQGDLFYQMFPQQVDVGRNNPNTIKWMLGRTRDGTYYKAPRELIHLLNTARDIQLRWLERGDTEPDGTLLFTRAAIKDALPEVSRVRLQQTLYAEYPSLRSYLELLAGEKTQQTIKSLARIWSASEDITMRIATQLLEVGFFELREVKGKTIYWVPFLYRDGLNLVQGASDEA